MVKKVKKKRIELPLVAPIIRNFIDDGLIWGYNQKKEGKILGDFIMKAEGKRI